MKSQKRNLIEKIANFLLNVLILIFGIFLLISVYTGIQTKVLGNEYTNFFGYSMFEVQTGSMADEINAGDWIIVKLTSKVAIDDVITYKLKDEYVTHRIVEVYKGTYITKGDANNAKDDPVDQSQIIGKVVKVLANFGIIRKTLFNPGVLITLVITLFLFNLTFQKNKIDEIKNKITELDKNKKFVNIINPLLEKLEKILEIIRKYSKIALKYIKIFINDVARVINGKKTKRKIENKESVRLETLKKELVEVKNDVTDKYIEDPLEKTSLFRVVSVNASEVDEKYRKILKEELKQEIEEDDNKEDELEKTALYRVISIPAKDVDQKYREILEKEKKRKEDISKVISINGNSVDDEIEKNEEYIEDELGKTSIFRIISVDTMEDMRKEEKFKKEEEELLEQTSLYRVIPVDASEIDKTFLEIAKNEMKESEQKSKKEEKKVEVKPEKEEVVKDKESENKIDLELLKGNKKNKNIMEATLSIKKEEVNEIIDILVKSDKSYINKVTMKNSFIDVYIDSRYHNIDDQFNGNMKKLTIKIKNDISEYSNELVKSYKGKDSKYSDFVNKYNSLFMVVADLEQAKSLISDSKAKTEFYRKEINKNLMPWNIQSDDIMLNQLLMVQKKYDDTLEFLLKKLDTNIFNLNFNKITNKKDMFGLELEHNISFSKVYSDYIIDKTYTEGIVAEDKMSVLLTLLSSKLVKDIMTLEFSNKYILYIPNSLYEKEKKYEKVLKMIDNEYAKGSVIILIKFTELLKYKKIIKEFMKDGYKFALVFDDVSLMKETNRKYIYTVDYIFIDKKDEKMKEIV